MPKTKFEGTTSVKKKDASESGMKAALRWLEEQADGWCQSGLCSAGKCRGVMSGTHIKLLSDTKDACEFEFSTEISCECPPVAEVPPQAQPQPVPVQPPLTPAQMKIAIGNKLKLLTHYNELIALPVPEPELSVIKTLRDTMKQLLLGEITVLAVTPAEASEFWNRVGDFIDAVSIGIIVEKLVDYVIAKGIGKALGPLAHILSDPEKIDGVDTEVVDTLIVRNPPNCYKITWYRTKWSDELLWGPVRIKVEKIPCD